MNIKNILSTYITARKLQHQSKKYQSQFPLNNERCENLYRCEDEKDDGRGNY